MNEKIKMVKGETIDSKLMDILLSVGISANLHGYNYLKESIKLAVTEPKTINSITKLLS